MPAYLSTRRLLTLTAVAVLLAACWFIPHLSAKDTDQQTLTPKTEPTRVAGPDVISWQNLAGIELPVSTRSGPHCLTKTIAACFAHDQAGATFAAVHILVRSFPYAGPAVFGPTIAAQVTGLDAARMARSTLQTYIENDAQLNGRATGKPIRVTGTTVAGYRTTSPPHGSADAQTVEVLIHQDPTDPDATSEYFAFTVRLLWQQGDWKVVAPEWGDWTTAAQPLTDPDPADWHPYDTHPHSTASPKPTTRKGLTCFPCA